MGNINSTSTGGSQLTAGIRKAQESENKLYLLVDLRGGGELVQWTKFAMKSGDSSILDGLIEMKVLPFLYGNGKGKLVAIADLVKMRNQERNATLGALQKKKGKGKSGPNILENIDQDQMQGDMMKALKLLDGGKGKGGASNYREVCWDINQRGVLGETLLHLCLLNGTTVHHELAKRLIQTHPKMVNDIYLSEEYYGQSALHQAIVNEDANMVQLLLTHGCDVHQRCYGALFCCEDQRMSRTDSLEHEWVDLPLKTNYTGRTYWGEYPLSFAACLDQEDCFRLLLANKVDVNLKDTNGNTVLHMTVIHSKPKMFDLAYAAGGNLHVRNKQQLTPLTLAAKLGNKKMFEHVLKIERDLLWTYGGVISAQYPLQYIDTIDEQTGETNTVSALALIVNEDTSDHIQLLDGLMEDLLKEKWKAFAKTEFIKRFCIYLVYVTVFFWGFILRPYDVDDRAILSSNDSTSASHETNHVQTETSHGHHAKRMAEIRNLNLSNVWTTTYSPPYYYNSIPKQHKSEEAAATVTVNPNSHTMQTVSAQHDPVVVSSLSSLEPSNPGSSEEQNEENAAHSQRVDYSGHGVSPNDTHESEPAPATESASPLLEYYSRHECFLLHVRNTDPEYYYYDIARLIFEFLTLLCALYYIITTAILMRKLGFKTYCKAMFQFPEQILLHSSWILVCMMVPLRVSCMPYYEHIFAILGVCTTTFNLLFFCSYTFYIVFRDPNAFRGVKFVALFVMMIFTIIRTDMIRWLLIYFIFCMGFSQAFYVIFSRCQDVTDKVLFPTFRENMTQKEINDLLEEGGLLEIMNIPVLDSIFRTFILPLGDHHYIFEELQKCTLQSVGQVLVIVYQLAAQILMTNMLIASVTKAAEKLGAMRDDLWRRQWAKMILLLEKFLTPDCRHLALLKYSRPIGTDKSKRAFVVRREQTTEEVNVEKGSKEVAWKKFLEDKRSLLKRRIQAQMERADADHFSSAFPGTASSS